MIEACYPLQPLVIVDDEPEILTSYDTILRYGGFDHIITYTDGRKVLSLLAEKEIELLVLDLSMPHKNGEELLREVNHNFPQIPVIIVTGTDEVETAVRCMKMGAFEYLVKPINGDRLIITVSRAIAYRELERENRSLKKKLLARVVENPEAFSDIITQDPIIKGIFQYIEAIATSPKPVLITGETGVGKELFARTIHALSGRRGPFVATNVAGLDDTLFTDTLFGHTKGAYTGAESRRSGLVEKASGGTFLLDEIGDLSPASQIKLLRLLQECEYFPIGEDLPRQADTRILATTNRDILPLKEKGLFRNDLFYRFCTHRIVIPPLRERPCDLPLLLEHFLEKAARLLGKKKPATPPELIVLLETYHFPGNVRELEAMVFDAMSLHEKGVMSMDVFKRHISGGSVCPRNETGLENSSLGSSVVFPDRLPSIKEMSLVLVDEAMRRSKGNIPIAAALLKISHQALRKRLKKIS